MSSRTGTRTAGTTGIVVDLTTPARLRSLPSRLLTQTAMHAMVTQSVDDVLGRVSAVLAGVA